MSKDLSAVRPSRQIRIVLLSLSIICALLPAVAVILAVDTDYKRAALAHDAAITAEAASQIGLTIRSVERQLEAVAQLAGTMPGEQVMMRSFLRAVKSSNHDLLQVGFLASHGRLASPSAGLPVYHRSDGDPYITITVPAKTKGGVLVAALAGRTVAARLRSLAGAQGANAYLFSNGGRLLAASGREFPHAAFVPVGSEHVSQRVVAGRENSGGHSPTGERGLFARIRQLRVLKASTWYVTETPIRDTDWVLLLERTHRGLLSSRFPLLFGAASALFAALLALLAAMLVHRSSGSPAKRRLEETVRRNEILLRETHHRVKNDLQILSSILHLSDRPGLAAAEHAILAESQNRVHAISLIHEMLYKSPNIAAGVSMRAYVVELIKGIESSLIGDTEVVSIVSNVGDFCFDADTSVACGLLLNELLTNSLKYAFPNGDGGVILVRMERVRGGRYLMQVQDDGVGLPDGYWLTDNNSLGMRLIRALTEQLDATVSVESDPGTSWRIVFDAREVALAAVR